MGSSQHYYSYRHRKSGTTPQNRTSRPKTAIVTEKSGHFFCVDAPKRRFKGWTWGLGGVTGLAHTALIVIGFFSIFSGILPFSLDIDQTFIAAILTIIGYAINDTVVIFDRIREYKELHPKADAKKEYK